MIKLNELLADFGVTKEQIIERDAAYYTAFDTHERIVDVYSRNPSERMAEIADQSATNLFNKIKTDMPDLFPAEVEEAASAEPAAPGPDLSFKAEKDRIRSLVEAKDHAAVQEWFNDQPLPKQGRMIEYNNFQLPELALKGGNLVLIYFFLDRAKTAGVYDSLVRAKGGDMFIKIVSTQDAEFVSDAVDSLLKTKAEAKELVKNGVAMQLAIESDNTEIIDKMEGFYDQIGAEKVVSKVGDMLSDLKGVKSTIDVIEKGEMELSQHTLYIKRKQALQFRIVGAISKTAKNYHIVHRIEDAAYFSGEKSIYKANGFEIREVDFIQAERSTGWSRYEMMKAWINFAGLSTLEHNIALMGIAKFAETMNLMLDKENEELKKSYHNKLNYVIANSRSLSVGNYYVDVREAHLEDFVVAGFLTEGRLPTELFYMLLYLHQFKFPFGTHPFECVSVPVENQFLYDVYRGKHGAHKFISDGELMYEDIDFIPKKVVKETLVEISREVVTNLENPATSKLKIADAINDGFIPLFYTVATSDSEHPPLQVNALSYAKRVINYGVYNFTSGINKTNIWINSFPIRSFIMSNDTKIKTYKGHLSRLLLHSSDGLILVDKAGGKLLLRAMNYSSLAAENWRTATAKKTMEVDFFNAIVKNSAGMMPLLSSALDVKSRSMFPPVLPKSKDVLPPAPVPASAERKPIVKHKVVRVARRDDRVYLTEKDAKDSLPKPLFDVYKRVKDLAAEDRDEAILKELLHAGIDAISPMNIVYLGFDLKRWAVKDTLIVMKSEKTMDKYELKMPSYITGLYYIKKVS